MNKNMVLALVLSVAVIYLWGEYVSPKPTEQDRQSRIQQTAETQEKEVRKEEVAQTVSSRSEGKKSGTGKIPVTGKNPEQQAKIQDQLMIADLSSIKGKVLHAWLVEEKFAKKHVDMTQGLKQGAYFPDISSVFIEEPDYILEQATQTEARFAYSQDGVTETKEIKLRKGYTIEIAKTVTNNSQASLDWTPSITYDSQHHNSNIFSAYNKKFEIQFMTSDNEVFSISSTDGLKEKLAEHSDVRWIGVNYSFFEFALNNLQEKQLSITGEIDDDTNTTLLSIAYPALTISPGEKATASFLFFFGPKEMKQLELAGNGLEQAVSFGWLDFLAKPLLAVLNFFYGFVHNYGIAIILLTLLIKILLWPLSMASFKSFAKMKKLAPKVNELKVKYKNDKEKFNKEMMQLYQKEGVNPLGGCFPMLIQMPIYIALYTMLNNAVELYNAPFLPFWLTDLSEQDPYYILPVAVGLLMFVQQRMTPQQMDNQQAKIMMWVMPPMFTAFLLFLPSGLNVYIFANSLLGILQQIYVNRKYA